VRVAHQQAPLFQVAFYSERYLGVDFYVVQLEAWIDTKLYIIVLTKVKGPGGLSLRRTCITSLKVALDRPAF
jgi:hypothetical protein